MYRVSSLQCPWFTLAHRAPAPRGARGAARRAAGGAAAAAPRSPPAASAASRGASYLEHGQFIHENQIHSMFLQLDQQTCHRIVKFKNSLTII